MLAAEKHSTAQGNIVSVFRLILLFGFIFTVFPVNAADEAGFSICSGPNRAARKVTCLVDGDTGWENGVKWRLIGIDTPEYAAHAECPEEPEQAAQATMRMLELMRGGYEIEWIGQKGGAGRDLVRVRLVNDMDAGQMLFDEGLAVLWPHPPRVFCNTP